MDREEYGESTEKILDEGIICKSAEVENQDVTEEEIKKINKFYSCSSKSRRSIYI